MKKFSEIVEGLKITSKSRVNETYKPKTTEELALTIKNLVNERGLEADLNDIDLSYITDISFAFQYVTKFNGDISLWDVSHIKYMGFLFKGIKFEGDISNWDVSNVEDMSYMFCNCPFDGDLSKWDVSKVKNMECMFSGSGFTGTNGDLSNWDVSNVENMHEMFYGSKFKGNIDNWKMPNVKDTHNMFMASPLFRKKPKWYKSVS